MRRMIAHAVWVSLLVISLIACGGGSDSGGGGTSSNSNSSQLLYDTYGDNAVTAGAFYKVDPTSLQSTMIDSSIVPPRLVEAATYNPSGLQLSDIHPYAVVYAKSGGLFKVSTMASDSATPAQISNETGTNNLCFIRSFDDYSDPDNSIITYTLKGSDNQCWTNDDIGKATKLGASASTTPVTIPTNNPVVNIIGIHDISNGAIKGFAALDNVANKLYSCDANFSNCTMLKSFTSDAGMREFAGTENVGIIMDKQLYIYNGGTRQLSAPIYTFTQTFVGTSVTDGSNLYLLADDKNIFKVTSSGTVSLIYTCPDSEWITGLYLTSDKIIFSTSPDGSPGLSTILQALPKGGGTPITLTTSHSWLYVIAISGNRIYYTDGFGYSPSATISSSIAGHVLSDGTNRVEVIGAYWAGGSYRNTISANYVNAYYHWNLIHDIDKILMVDGCLQSGCGGAALKSYDTSSYSGSVAIGTLPIDIISFSAFGHSNNFLGTGHKSINGGQNDIFYLDVSRASSLVRVTNSSSLSESVID